MKNLIIFILLPLFSYANGAHLVEKFFAPSGIKDKEAVYAGEMLDFYINRPTLGQTLPADVNKKYRVLASSKEKKVFAVLLSKDGQTQDWYVYLVKQDNAWKISAIRNLALPPLFFKTLQALQSKDDRTKEEEFQYQNMLLTLKSDAALKAYLRNNLKQFTTITKLAKTSPIQATEAAQSLYIDFLSYESESGIVDLKMGSVVDNSVGYLFVPDGATVPNMSEDNYIYIEHITGNWYIYKTT